MIIELKNVAINWPAVFAPQSSPGGKAAYGGKLTIEPGSANHKQLIAAMETEAKNKWKEKGEAILKTLKEDKRVAYSESEYKNKDGVPYAGFENKYALSCRSETVRPGVYHRDGITPIHPDDNLIHSGSIVNAFVDIYAFDKPEFGRRINSVLTGIQYVSPGDKMGGSGAVSPGMFAPIVDDLGDLV
jgi:hypothetical protein